TGNIDEPRAEAMKTYKETNSQDLPQSPATTGVQQHLQSVHKKPLTINEKLDLASTVFVDAEELDVLQWLRDAKGPTKIVFCMWTRKSAYVLDEIGIHHTMMKVVAPNGQSCCYHVALVGSRT
ncbi:hypothetical protein PFISCL1PPCAC_25091, partial [Pristionchus fissidentatus]